MADDAPLDFEAEDRILFLSLAGAGAKRKKVICFEELFDDFLEEKEKLAKIQSKKCAARKKRCNSDDEDDRADKSKERLVSKFVNECQGQVYEMNAEDDASSWGYRIFGCQKPPPRLNLPSIQNSNLLLSFTKKELSSLLPLNAEEGNGFLEGLLINGWLSNLAFTGFIIEDSIASWTFYNMLYTTNVKLQDAACEFWCNILLCKTGVDRTSIKLGWYPSYSDLKDALQTYGYESGSNNVSSDQEVTKNGPPLNIRSWVKILAACCKIRDFRPIFSASEVEEFLSVIISFFLDRQLQGILFLLCECEQSIISYFMENEWSSSCNAVAASVTCSTPKDVNCLRVVECISGDSIRSTQLKSRVAFLMLSSFFVEETDGKGMLELISQINVKDKGCDFLKLYKCIFLADNWLLACDADKDVLLEVWLKCLKNCSTQITSTDWRPYASKVRNIASYLQQEAMHKMGC